MDILNRVMTICGWCSFIILIFITVLLSIGYVVYECSSRKKKEVESLPHDIDTGDNELEIHRRYKSTQELKEKIHKINKETEISEKKGILTLKELDFLHHLVDEYSLENQNHKE